MDYGVMQTELAGAQLERRIRAIYKEAERDTDRKLRDFNRRYASKEKMYAKQVKDGKISQSDFDAWKRGQVFQGEQWKAKREQIAHTLTNANLTSTKLINGNTAGVFMHNANYMAYDIEHGAGVNFGFGLYDRNTVSRLLKDNPQMLPKWKINEPKDYIWNEKKVNAQTLQGIIQGEGLDEIAKRISRNLSAQNENLMKTFARTAMTGAQNAGRLARMYEARGLGIEIEKEWMATLDGFTRDSHADIDGEVVPLDSEFSNQCMYPGDSGGPPAEVYNCRCTMVSNIKKYPDKYERRDNIDGVPIRSMSYREWSSLKETGRKAGVKATYPTPEKFKQSFDMAKSTLPKGGEWRVDDTHTVRDYEPDKLFKLPGGSVVAVTPSGNIISVCKNTDGADRGGDLLKLAVANGGDRLDAFGDGLYQFYTKMGFEPVSWTPFNEEYAPHDWVKGRDKAEEVIFYRYTGKTTNMSYVEFITSVNPSADYDTAEAVRDRLIDSAKRK